MSLSTGERNRRLHKVLRWARKKSNQELSDYIARFPKAAGWMTKSEGMVNINLMSDNHLLNSIALLRRNIMMTKLQTGQTSLSLLYLRYMEDEANDRGLNHENNS